MSEESCSIPENLLLFKLDPPLVVNGVSAQDRLTLFESTRKYVQFLSQADHAEIMRLLGEADFKTNTVAICPARSGVAFTRNLANKLSFDLKTRQAVSRQQPVNLVLALVIAVNVDFFKRPEGDFQDLIPFVVEHELYELWFTVKTGLDFKSLKNEQIEQIGPTRHLLARQREIDLVLRQGKILKYLHFLNLIGYDLDFQFTLRYLEKLGRRALNIRQHGLSKFIP